MALEEMFAGLDVAEEDLDHLNRVYSQLRKARSVDEAKRLFAELEGAHVQLGRTIERAWLRLNNPHRLTA